MRTTQPGEQTSQGGAATQSQMGATQVSEVKMRIGEKTVPFDHQKLMQSLIRAGVSEDQANEIATAIQRTARHTMTTEEIDHDVQEMLEKKNPQAFKTWMQWREKNLEVPWGA